MMSGKPTTYWRKPRSRAQLAAVFLGLLILAPSPLRAERLLLNNGNQVTGKIESESLDRIILRTPSGTVTFPRSAVRSIDRQTQAQETVSVFSAALTRADLEQALSAIPSNLAPAARAQIDSLLLSTEPQLTARARPSLPIAVRLQSYIETRDTPPSPQLRLFLARYLAAAGDTTGAISILRRLNQAQIASLPQARSLAADLLTSRIASALEEGSSEEGLDHLELLSAIAPERITTSTAILLRLREAQRLADRGAFLPAAEEIGVFVLPNAPATGLKELAGLIQRAEKVTSASALIPVYDAAFRHLNACGFSDEAIPICQKHISALLLLMRIGEARTVAARLSRIDPDAGAPYEHRVEFSSRKADVASNDVIAQYRLGVWAREVGLFDEARPLLRAAQLQPDLQENAALQLKLLANEEERQTFLEACRLLEEKKYEAAKAALEAFRSDHPNSEYAKRAGELAELARYQLWHAANRRPEEAEVLLQNAERLYLQARYDEAVTLLNQIAIDFRSTAAAARADKLRTAIRKKTSKSASASQPENAQSAQEARRLAEIQAMALDLARQSLKPQE